jgi:putative acetyltransferase
MRGFTIREEVPDDAPAIRRVVEEAFGGPVESQLVELLREADDVVLALVAADQESQAILGYVLFSRMQLHGVRTVGLAPVAVLPEQQKSGIGAALIRAGLERLRERGEQAVFVLGHAEYYPRFGFQRELAAQFESPYAGPHFFALELVPGVLTGRSGPVEYAPAFSSFE